MPYGRLPARERPRDALDPRTRKEWFALGGFLLLVVAAAALGSLWTDAGLQGWYEGLRKPAWTPPGLVISLVWGVLYPTMGVAAWLVWREAGWRRGRVALGLFLAQLALNVAWSGLFFGLRNPAAAFADIVALWFAIAATLVAFWRVRPLAGALMLPYLAWVGFAAFLNLAIVRLNA